MRYFTAENTDGYTDEQLTTLNQRYAQALTEHGFTERDMDDWARSGDHIAARVLATFDTELAEKMRGEEGQAMTAPVLPVIHLNGTSRASLLDNACEVGRAVGEALRILHAHGPNQRDYYPDPPRWAAVQVQHAARVAALQAVYQSIEDEAIAISNEEG